MKIGLILEWPFVHVFFGLIMRKAFLFVFLLFTIATCAIVDIKTEEEALEFISQEGNGTEENVKELIVKVIILFE